ncbi:C45 family autoproteolytic acyltransferase/hydrolase [Paenibacillus filicis]|uniref:C45 family autoproteolytic acyltransferase/hydrolase n=1 Tax=Paenibacillus gyeongsangnamensis TaxID=3388067 RepID=A0ABT4QGR3_9BACL|nr:C45 family peptidase [Paenibacillus filicis]MCZ8516044.1 C45 family autoproteolytic acyltransferase/hydrolase [Paenibacillus filicis]
MLHISLFGTPKERGRAQGETFRPQIHELLELSKSMFLSSIKLDDVSKLLTQMFEYTNQYEPDLIAEMEGISEAAAVDLQDIFLLHAASAVSSLGPNCTNIVINHKTDGPLLGKTSDIGDDYKYYMLQQTTTHDGQRFIAIGWVGTVWIEVGMNHHGFAIGQSSAPIAPNQDGSGLPTLICPRPALTRCKSVPEAIQYFQTRKMAGKGLNMMLLDQDGNSAVVEKSGSYQKVRSADNSVLFCTNHFISEEMKDFRSLNINGIQENSHARFAYLSRTLSSNPEQFGKPMLQEVLKSHEAPICQHADSNLSTHYAYILAPRQLEFMITDGHPCENEFQTYRV